MTTKINKISQKVSRTALLTSSFLTRNGISRKEQTCYVKSGWLERVAHGVYRFAGESPGLYDALASYASQTGKDYHLAAGTALDLRGYTHFIPMGRSRAFLSSTGSRLPGWIVDGQWDRDVFYFTTDVFGNAGLEDFQYGNLTLRISSPERAVMECMLLAPRIYSLMDVYYLMEMLATLRPELVNELLSACKSVKVKRVFLYMADKTGFWWAGKIDGKAVDTGKGTRSVEKGGVLIDGYGIVVSKELAAYE